MERRLESEVGPQDERGRQTALGGDSQCPPAGLRHLRASEGDHCPEELGPGMIGAELCCWGHSAVCWGCWLCSLSPLVTLPLWE